ncbi:MAG: hypothetical protein U1F57_07465 [bacterium]
MFTPSKPASLAAPGFSVSSESILDRSHSRSPMSAFQTQVDEMVGGFVEQATEWKSLAAMMAGGAAYRCGKIAFLGAASKLPLALKNPLLMQAGSAFLGLATEVTVFEATNRSLHTFFSDGVSHNSWKWSGKGGLKEGWLSSFINFGILKGFGKLSEGQNVLLQHASQDLAMVMGHHVLFGIGWGEKQEGSLSEQLLHAEATNLQLGAGMSLAHEATGGRLTAWERSLDFNIRSQESGLFAGEKARRPLFSHPLLFPMWMMMSADGAGGGIPKRVEFSARETGLKRQSDPEEVRTQVWEVRQAAKELSFHSQDISPEKVREFAAARSLEEEPFEVQRHHFEGLLLERYFDRVHAVMLDWIRLARTDSAYHLAEVLDAVLTLPHYNNRLFYKRSLAEIYEENSEGRGSVRDRLHQLLGCGKGGKITALTGEEISRLYERVRQEYEEPGKWEVFLESLGDMDSIESLREWLGTRRSLPAPEIFHGDGPADIFHPQVLRGKLQAASGSSLLARSGLEALEGLLKDPARAQGKPDWLSQFHLLCEIIEKEAQKDEPATGEKAPEARRRRLFEDLSLLLSDGLDTKKLQSDYEYSLFPDGGVEPAGFGVFLSYIVEAQLAQLPEFQRQVALRRLLQEKDHADEEVKQFILETAHHFLRQGEEMPWRDGDFTWIQSQVQDPSKEVALKAMKSVGQVAHRHPEAITRDVVKNLMETGLNHPDHERVVSAAEALGEIGFFASKRLPVDAVRLLGRKVFSPAPLPKGVDSLPLFHAFAKLILSPKKILSDRALKVLREQARRDDEDHQVDSFLKFLSRSKPDHLDKGRHSGLVLKALARLTPIYPERVSPEVFDFAHEILMDRAGRAADPSKALPAAKILGVRAREERGSSSLNSVWSQLGLLEIRFADQGNGVSTVPWFMEGYLHKPPKRAEPISIGGVAYRRRSVSLDRFLSSFRVQGPPRQMGRSFIYPLAGENQMLVIKYAKGEQRGVDLLREAQWLQRIHEEGLLFGNDLPVPVKGPSGEVELLSLDGKPAIALRAPRDYYNYLDDPLIPEGQFFTGLKKALRGIFGLAKRGVYHAAPVSLFHNVEPGAATRATGDRGKYVIAPDVVFDFIARSGMGRLNDWPGALRYGNFSTTGWRDAEELASLSELMKPKDERMPELRGLQGKPNAEALYDANVLGNTLLAATLYVGNRMAQEAKTYQGADPYWKNDAWLKKYANALRELYAAGFAVRHDLREKEALKILSGRADWLRLARQLAFFMTPAYVPFVQPGQNTREFPKEIYGDVLLGKKMGPYREGTFDAERGFIGPDGNPEALSLGPVNGQFPIREFEKAFWAVFLDPPTADLKKTE